MGILPRRHQSDQRRLGCDFVEPQRSRNTSSSPCAVPFNLVVGSPRNGQESSLGRAGRRGGLTRYVEALLRAGRDDGRQSNRRGCRGRPTKERGRFLRSGSALSGGWLIMVASQLGSPVYPPSGPHLYAASFRPPTEVASSFSTSKPVPFFNMKYTARANLWARMALALNLPCATSNCWA
jgi:hypothetical protein